MKYRKKPVVIEAFKWTGWPDQTDYPVWAVEAIKAGSIRFENSGTPSVVMLIDTLEGTMRGNQGDYIIQGVKGEMYPCKNDIFEMTYEKPSTAIAEAGRPMAVGSSAVLFRWVMIRVVNIADAFLYHIASTNGRGRLEILAYRRGWVEMWPGRKEMIEYSIEHRQEIEDYRNGGWRTAPIERLEKRVQELENANRHNARVDLPRIKDANRDSGCEGTIGVRSGTLLGWRDCDKQKPKE